MTVSAKRILTGGEIIAKILEQVGIKHIFTLTGGHISPILVAAEREKIRVIDVRHEVNAVFAADALSRVSGSPGVVAVTAGPGVTNTLTALKNAEMAESSIVIFGGATATSLKGRGSLQDIDQIALIKSTTKWHKMVKRVKEIVPVVRKALLLSQSGTPGPVFIELPVDVLYERSIVEDQYKTQSFKGNSIIAKIGNWYLDRHVSKIFADAPSSVNISVPDPAVPIAKEKEVILVSDLVNEAERPLCLLSQQAVQSVSKIPELIQALEILHIPIFLSSGARGLMGRDHDLHFSHRRSAALKQADLVILAGTIIDFRLKYGMIINRNAVVIAINKDKDALNLNRILRIIDHKILGDPSDFLVRLSAHIATPDWSKWMRTLETNENERLSAINDMVDDEMQNVDPLRLLQYIENVMSEDSVIIADGGDFVATMSYILSPRGPLRWLDPGPFGTLGVGAGFALGAKLNYPSADIWLFYGDGAAGYSIIEFDSFLRHDTPVLAIVGNDASWQQIAREQVVMLGSDVATKLNATAYEKVVESLGGKGIIIKNNNQIAKGIDQAIELYHEGHSVLVNVLLGEYDFRKGSISM